MPHPNPRGFLEYHRETPASRLPEERVRDYRDIYLPFPKDRILNQASRCMGCGVPFCHDGCPLGNLIPDFNEAVANGDWHRAYQLLSATNNFPEFTGRICPAPCEGSCVLGINHPPVTIELIEKSIIEQAFAHGWVKPDVPEKRSGKKVAIIGSGPAGLAAAEQLNKAGHLVTVFERAKRPGGLLTYGIPDFKLEKWVVDRRLDLMRESGIEFTCDVQVGTDIDASELRSSYDAILVATGATLPRDIQAEGRELTGINYAMDFLYRQNKKVYGEWRPEIGEITATGKDVVVIGGGDTGSDCIGTSHRQGANSVTQITWGDRLPDHRVAENPWPEQPRTLQTTSSHEEGGDREWSIITDAFLGDENGHIRAIRVVTAKWNYDDKGRRLGFERMEETLREIPCTLALISMGFKQPETGSLFEQLGMSVDEKGKTVAKGFQTPSEGVFVAGDMRIGQSLVVNAIFEGREAATAIDTWLKKTAK